MENERGRGWNEERGWSYRSWRWIRWNDYEHFVDFQKFSGINLLNSTNSIYVCPMICTSAGHSLTKLFIGFWFECYIKGVFTQIFTCITRHWMRKIAIRNKTVYCAKIWWIGFYAWNDLFKLLCPSDSFYITVSLLRAISLLRELFFVV